MRKKLSVKYSSWARLQLGMGLVLLILLVADRVLKNYFYTCGRFAANRGLAFGLALNQIVLWVIVLLVLGGVIYLLARAYQSRQATVFFAFCLITVGAVSNLWDRWQWGFVVDYLNWPPRNIFNLADVMILAGVGILVWQIFRKHKK